MLAQGDRLLHLLRTKWTVDLFDSPQTPSTSSRAPTTHAWQLPVYITTAVRCYLSHVLWQGIETKSFNVVGIQASVCFLVAVRTKLLFYGKKVMISNEGML